MKHLVSSMTEILDISVNIVDSITVADNGHFEHRITFGTNDPEKNQNIVMNAIHAVASLKDIIKNKLNKSGANSQLYENLINNNLSLMLITDLDNKDKHGDPLKNPPRSDWNPRIVDIQQALRGKGITRAAFTTNFSTGKTTQNAIEGDVSIVVTANIVDALGKRSMALHKMLDDSLVLVENFVEKHNLLK